MENEATRFVVVDRGVLTGIVNSLKKLDVRGGYDDYDRLVGCVTVLENLIYAPPEKKVEEKEG